MVPKNKGELLGKPRADVEGILRHAYHHWRFGGWSWTAIATAMGDKYPRTSIATAVRRWALGKGLPWQREPSARTEKGRAA